MGCELRGHVATMNIPMLSELLRMCHLYKITHGFSLLTSLKHRYYLDHVYQLLHKVCTPSHPLATTDLHQCILFLICRMLLLLPLVLRYYNVVVIRNRLHVSY